MAIRLGELLTYARGLHGATRFRKPLAQLLNMGRGPVPPRGRRGGRRPDGWPHSTQLKSRSNFQQLGWPDPDLDNVDKACESHSWVNLILSSNVALNI